MTKFKKIYIEITNICNFKCSFCPVTKRKAEFLSVAKFSEILDQISLYTKYIYLHVKGEPFTHPNFLELLKIAKEKNFFVNITTNGGLIDKYCDQLSTSFSPRQINFSLHSFDGIIDAIDKNRYLDNILNFVEKSLFNNETYISLRFWNFNSKNYNDLKEQGNLYIFDKIEKKFDLNYKIKDLLIPGKGLKIKDKLYINSEIEFIWPSLSNDYYEENGYCHALKQQIGILVDGTVIPCCLDGEGVVNLGNIFNTPFKDIIENNRFKNILKGFSNHKAVEELCKRCQFKEKF